MNHLRSNVCCHTSTKNILPNQLKLAWIGHTCAVLHSLSVCTAISRKLVEECVRPRFQAFAPVVHINGRHYLNVTTQNVQQKEHLKSQFLKEQSLVSILLLQLSLRLISSTHWCCCKMNDPLEHSLTVLQGGKTDGREESCSCYSGLHARHAVHVRPAAGGRIHRVLWVLRQLLPWLQGGQPSVALHNQVHGVLHHRLTRGARCRVRCRRLLQDLPLLHLRHGRHRWWQEALVNTAILLLIIFVFVYEFFVFAFGFARDNWFKCCSSLRWWLHRELELVQEQAHLTMTGDGSWVASEKWGMNWLFTIIGDNNTSRSCYISQTCNFSENRFQSTNFRNYGPYVCWCILEIGSWC